jgi:hypothetical protein
MYNLLDYKKKKKIKKYQNKPSTISDEKLHTIQLLSFNMHGVLDPGTHPGK